jgi:hypothetical protein
MSNRYPQFFIKDFRGHQHHRTSELYDYVLEGCLKGRELQKNPDTLLEPRTTIQSETKTISTESLTMVPNSSLLLHKVRDICEHDTEYCCILVMGQVEGWQGERFPWESMRGV